MLPAAAGQPAPAPSLPPALQAFRHLYVLAAQPRSVDAIDVDTKQARVHWGHSTCLAGVAASACPPDEAQAIFSLPTMPFTCLMPSAPLLRTVQPVYVPLEIELSSPAIPALGDVNHAGSVLRPVASVSKVGYKCGGRAGLDSGWAVTGYTQAVNCTWRTPAAS